MQPTAILYPVFVLVGLTIYIQVGMARERGGALRRGEVKREQISLGEPNWPPPATQYANSFRNQFELPVLFYAVVAFAMITSRVDFLLVLLAWIFVVSRVVHAYVHTTTNYIPHRLGAYTIGAIALSIMWIYFAVTIVLSPLLA